MDVVNKNEQWKLLVFLLDEIRKEKGLTMQDVADASGYLQSNVARFFSAKYRPGLDVFLSVAKAIGVNFFFEDKEGITDLNTAFQSAMERMGRIAGKLPKN